MTLVNSYIIFIPARWHVLLLQSTLVPIEQFIFSLGVETTETNIYSIPFWIIGRDK